MTQETAIGRPRSAARRRWIRAAGWALVILGMIVSWAWSVERTIAGDHVHESIAGVATFVLFGVGIALIRRVSPHRGRKARTAYRAAIIACAVAAVIAGVTPIAAVATTTGTVTARASSDTSARGYTVSDVAVVSSDAFRRTGLDLTIRASDRTAPLLEATIAFTDGTADLTCANTRQIWIHEVSTVTLACADFVSIKALKNISGVAVTPR